MTSSNFMPENESLLAGKQRQCVNQCLDNVWILLEGQSTKTFVQQVRRVHVIGEV